MLNKTKLAGTGALLATLAAGLPAWAQDAVAAGPIKAPTVEQMAGMVNKGDTACAATSGALIRAVCAQPGAAAKAEANPAPTPANFVSLFIASSPTPDA